MKKYKVYGKIKGHAYVEAESEIEALQVANSFTVDNLEWCADVVEMTVVDESKDDQ